MGCATSRLDDLPAVALCRDRRNFLADALQHRSALAGSHVAYTRSLQRVGRSLHAFCGSQSNPAPASSPRAAATSPDSSPPSSSPSRSETHDELLSRETTEFASLNYSRSQPLRSEMANSNPNSDAAYDYSKSAASPPPLYGGGYASKTPPPPPAAVGNSAWEFLNLFQEYERYELPFIYDNHHRSPKEVAKDDESLPNFESQTPKREVVKEIGGGLGRKRDRSEETRHGKEEPKSKEANAVESKGGKGSGARSASESTKEIQILLERASESGDEVSDMLQSQAGRFHFLQKDEAEGMDSGNLASAMEKLYMWEKKLYDEVKAEEKLRMIHEKKCRQLKGMDEKGADANKINSTSSVLITLSTKIKISIQVVDKISITINKLRDEELWPQINSLIHGLIRMWRTMLECHRSLSHAVAEAKGLDIISSSTTFRDSHLEAMIQLKLELQNWNLCFSNWVDCQKRYVKALNDWLLRCLFHEPEQMPDGSFRDPSSPSMIGAPPIFIVCKQWSQAMERLSEKEVVDAMGGFVMSLNRLLEQHNVELQQKMMVDKDLERKVRTSEREEQKMQKLMMQGQNRKMAVAAAGFVSSGEVSNVSGLHFGLKQIFEAMERFTDKSTQAYEELSSDL